jgi:16S rRNA G966 N2-methylase RsmD
VVLDPPYDFESLDEAVRDAATQRTADGIVILEHASRVTPPRPDGLTLTRTVKSGDSALTFYS